jgi:hypothetical protein
MPSYKVGPSSRFHDYDAKFRVKVISFLEVGWLNAIRAWQEEFVANTNSREFVENVTFSMVK